MPQRPLTRYVVAILAVLAAVALRAGIEILAGRSFPYLSFLLAVGGSTWGLGLGPGLLTLALSAAVLAFWTPLRLIGFVILGASIVALVDFIGRTRRAARRASSELARQQESLRRAELTQAELAAIVAWSDDAIVGKDLNEIVTSWNRGAERLYGYSAAEIIGQPITGIIPADRLAEEDTVLSRIRAGQRVDHFDTVRMRKDGTLVDVSVAVSPIRDSTGAIVGASKIARDISERSRTDRMREELLARERLAREEANAARDRLAFLAEVSAVLTSSLDYEQTLDRAVHLALPRLGDYSTVLVQDEHGQLKYVASGHVVRAREATLRELAVRLLESPGQTSTTFAHAVMKNGKTMVVTHEMLARAVEQRAELDPEVERLGHALRPHAYVGVPLLVRGRVAGVMSFGTSEPESHREFTDADVAQIEEFARRVSLAVENARLFRQADELNRLKDEFLATLSHELRTPLSAVLGWARMLRSGQLEAEKASQAVQAIERSAEAQAKIVDDILDLARGVAGNLHLDMARFDLAAAVRRSVDAMAPGATAKRIHVTVTAPEPVAVFGDPGRLQQVMWNLLSNAVKFTPAGGSVAIDVRGQNGHAVMEVTDSGIGIPQAFLPFVFDKFRQADASFTRQHGGLGLGLAIARHLVELHGGTIEARSAGEGTGASFIVSLPLAASGSAENSQQR